MLVFEGLSFRDPDVLEIFKQLETTSFDSKELELKLKYEINYFSQKCMHIH